MSKAQQPDPVVDAILSWWRALYPDADRNYRGDAASRAVMRRAETAGEALMLPPFHDLLRLFRSKGGSPASLGNDLLKRMALAVTVVCERRDNASGLQSFAEVLGSASEGEHPPLSPLRFQALMAVMGRADETEQMTALRRALAQVKDRPFNIKGLVRDLLQFSETTRIRWTFDYYGTRREAQAGAAGDETLSDAEETI